MKYRVSVSIMAATGEREYTVEANSPSEALAKAEEGTCECTYESIEANELDWENAEAEEDNR